MFYDKIFIISVGILILIVVTTMGTYYHFTKEKEKIQNVWQKLHGLLQIRHDILPRILQSLKETFPEEKELFFSTVKARAQAMQNRDKSILDTKEEYLLGLLEEILQIFKKAKGESKVEFSEIKKDLEKINLEIKEEEKKYNKIVRKHNRNLRRFPLIIIAQIFKFMEEKEFEG